MVGKQKKSITNIGNCLFYWDFGPSTNNCVNTERKNIVDVKYNFDMNNFTHIVTEFLDSAVVN